MCPCRQWMQVTLPLIHWHIISPNLSIHFSPYIIPSTLPLHFHSNADSIGSAMGSSRDPMSLQWLDPVWTSLRSRVSLIAGLLCGCGESTCVRSRFWFGIALESNLISIVRSAVGSTADVVVGIGGFEDLR